MYKILFVDDEKFMCNSIIEYFDGTDYKVFIANNGMEGLHIFTEEQPDLVITDLIMPDMEGLEFIRKLQRINKQLPIIVISGNMLGFEYLDAACILGAQARLRKPFDLEELRLIIEDLLGVGNK